MQASPPTGTIHILSVVNTAKGAHLKLPIPDHQLGTVIIMVIENISHGDHDSLH